jgi:hypothetical protein
MTKPFRRPTRPRRLLSWVQWGGALSAAVALALLCLPGPARAEGNGYDQMTGVGLTASAVTVPWTQGLLDASNNPIASANADRSSSNSTSPLSFMYKDFQNLKVTVSQTQDITHQGVTVTWTGGQPTAQFGTIQANFLQMMECYGDSSSGPTPEQCEYGSRGLLPAGVLNPGIGERTGSLCPAGAVPVVPGGVASLDSGGAPNGCDTQEPGSGTSHLAPPCTAPSPSCGTFTIPFAPVSDPTSLDYSANSTYYNEFTTDEVQETVTSAGGTGQQQFETLTGGQAPGLGCGQPDAGNNNQPRGCWLVIVPRGQYEPNGYQVNLNSANSALHTSPLSASNWAQRIQIHLSFAPVQAFCPLGTLERPTVGTQLVTRALQSWQLALNSAAKCTKIYGFTAVPEPTSTQDLTDSTNTAGLAFTTIPIGSEATRTGGSPPANLPPILYAPVAITALGFGFNINEGTGYVTTPVKLTPSLLARSLTQSYKQDLPDFEGNPQYPGPTWAQANPLNISTDPQFTKLNQAQGVPSDPTGPINPQLILEHTALNQQIWQWVQADSTASAWLGGTSDPNNPNMVIDPDYKAINLGKAPASDTYPRAYNPVSKDPSKPNAAQCADLGAAPNNPAQEEIKCDLDLLPYTDNFDSAASAVLTANNPDAGGWDPAKQAPNGSFGYWDKGGVQPLGQIFMWAATDTSDMAAYGLIPAQLCGNDGSTCVSPSTSSVTIALNAAKADSSGLLHVDPANAGTDGYPLVDVIYAAVRTNQDPTALNDYADLISYAAGSGQAIGAAAGDLPPGYLPLPANLQAQAQAVVTQLRNGASASPSPTPTTGATTPGGGDMGGGSTPLGTTSGAATSAATGAGTTGSSPGGTTTGNSTPRATPAATAGTTPTPNGSHPASSPSCSPSSSSLPTRTPSPSPTRSPSPSPSCSPSPGGPVTSLPSTHAVAGITPKQVIGAVRWALIGVMIAGVACAGGGTLLSSGRIPPWLRRRRPQPPGAAPPEAGPGGSP